MSDALYVPQDQLQRCMDVCTMFGYYKEKYVILAFKFMSKKRIVIKGQKAYEKRELKYYYKNVNYVFNTEHRPIFKCNYAGELFAIIDGQTFSTETKGAYSLDYDMSFLKPKKKELVS
jgi:Holliday junction resolvase